MISSVTTNLQNSGLHQFRPQLSLVSRAQRSSDGLPRPGREGDQYRWERRITPSVTVQSAYNVDPGLLERGVAQSKVAKGPSSKRDSVCHHVNSEPIAYTFKIINFILIRIGFQNPSKLSHVCLTLFSQLLIDVGEHFS